MGALRLKGTRRDRQRVAALCVTLSVVVLAGCGGSSQPRSTNSTSLPATTSAAATSTSSAASTTPAAQTATQQCINQWNSSGSLKLMSENTQGYTLFAEVGTYDGVAGSCGIVAVMPDYYGGYYSNQPGATPADVATVFYTCSSGWCQAQSTPEASLPATATNWNAHVSPDGSLGLGAPQVVTNTQSQTSASSSAATTTALPTAPGSCNLVSVKSGTVSCATALSVANAAIANPQANANTTVTEQGFACYVYPYEVDCSSSTATFSALYGTTGSQTG
jgi:hypothetical protein